MTKLLLINPSIRESSPPKHVPLGCLYVLTCAKEWYGADVALFDVNALRDIAKQPEIEADLAAAVQEEDWAVIGVGGITTTYNSIKRILKIVRPLTDALIVLGGGGFTAQPREWLHLLPEADIGIFSEAVKTIGDVLCHAADRDFREVKGVLYRNKDGDVKTAGERHDSVSMDDLPLPIYELAPLDIYFKNSSILMSEESLTAKRRLDAISSIGCSLSCTFCYDLGLTGLTWNQQTQEMIFPRSHPMTVTRVNRWASPEKCVRDWKTMREKYNCDFISLLDENIATMEAVHPSHNWIERVSELCIEAGLQPQCVKDGVPHDPERCSGLHFGSTSHSALIRPQTLRAMKAMGYSYLDYGLEAADDRILKHIRKGATLKTNVRGVIMTMRHGIRPIPNQLTGEEIEDFESIRRMVVFWEVMGIICFPFLYTPYPGSDIWYRNKEKIMQEFGDDMDLFISSLNDATEPVVSISKNFTLEEILLYRFHMVRLDHEAIDRFENVWRIKRGLPARGKEEQTTDWDRFKAEVQRYSNEAWAEQYPAIKIAS